ncbi:MarR family winged helix-turn-helix transcriptional regulator [Litorilinea aerophila]|uniref:Winged helix-turn-helix transcriptional regulator n=1 Tax=Litorilinea aerophila TaxID=1204385 RepID=A0A540VB46_9CHLR|nr:MarR family winged helix-turn-helix transcriptional regulator [Litorilinea aerophila]MCC9078138.1 MarR family winged helix-turn-helix transcriptional regulator [Litorilinea aerophila]OUC05878.1 hypothetical protein RY27_24545 [Litorilinea aerophila]GIV79893.1 MAG: hypothetical protein KatS3mg050_4287 [Litorilinea sp.]
MDVSPDECARTVLDVVPAVMQAIRAEVRRHRGADLSVLQVRVLAFLNGHPGSTLSAVAEHVGLTLPSMSSQISRLVQRGLVARETSPHDRRCVTLRLTTQGAATLEAARQAARAGLAETLSALSPTERATVVEALQRLRPLFAAASLPSHSASQASENAGNSS